jgi:hypothetical protein
MGTVLLFPFMKESVRADPLVVLLSDYALTTKYITCISQILRMDSDSSM